MLESRKGLVTESGAEVLACMTSLLTTSNKGTFRLLSNHYPITQQRYDFCCNKRLVELGHAVILPIDKDELKLNGTKYLANLVVQESADQKISTEAIAQSLHELCSFAFENKIKSVAISSIDNKYHCDIKELILSMFEKISGIKILLYSSTT